MLTNHCQARSRRSVLLVEPRDEVFARLAGDLQSRGFRVLRAKSAARAARYYARHRAGLLLVSPALPDESGWLFLSKLRLAGAAAQVWVYTAHASPGEVDLANFVRADELIEYGGDVWRLAEQVLDRFDDGLAVGHAGPLPGNRAVA